MYGKKMMKKPAGKSAKKMTPAQMREKMMMMKKAMKKK